jgi:hypothetical protein
MRRALKHQELHDVVQFITKGPRAPAPTRARIVEAKQASLAADLRRFGEDAVAIKVESLSAVEIDSVHARGMKIAFAGTPLLKAVCLAAVQTVEGKARPLARKRRRAAT